MPLLGSSFDGPVPCVVYALMEEGSLQDRLACRAAGVGVGGSSSGGGGGGGMVAPLSAAERACVLSDVARGLAHMHASSLVHRDVKVPSRCLGCLPRALTRCAVSPDPPT